MKALLKTITNWRNKRTELKNRSKLTGIYLSSVGHSYPLPLYDEQNSCEYGRNKEKHKTLWNKGIKKKKRK
jgi:hypothetical protein